MDPSMDHQYYDGTHPEYSHATAKNQLGDHKVYSGPAARVAVPPTMMASGPHQGLSLRPGSPVTHCSNSTQESTLSSISALSHGPGSSPSAACVTPRVYDRNHKLNRAMVPPFPMSPAPTAQTNSPAMDAWDSTPTLPSLERHLDLEILDSSDDEQSSEARQLFLESSLSASASMGHLPMGTVLPGSQASMYFTNPLCPTGVSQSSSSLSLHKEQQGHYRSPHPYRYLPGARNNFQRVLSRTKFMTSAISSESLLTSQQSIEEKNCCRLSRNNKPRSLVTDDGSQSYRSTPLHLRRSAQHLPGYAPTHATPGPGMRGSLGPGYPGYNEREPDRDYTNSHKLISNFSIHPMTAAERVLLSTTYHRGSWNAIDPLPNGVSSRTYNKGIVDIHDFRPLRVIGKGSYGKVFLVENKHWNSSKQQKEGAKALPPPAAESSIFRDTLSWMSNRNWLGQGQPKPMGEEEGCHRLYAMKVLSRDTVIKKQQLDHTMTENQVLKFLKHPMIIDMHFAFKTKNKLFMILEYCPGGELFHHLSEMGIFPEAKAKFYAGCILLALEHMHKRGVVYRDLKPENIVMDPSGYIRLTDFGLAKANIRDNHSAKSVCGTPEYLAPEVLAAQGHGLSVDHWGLAALIYEMLTGLPPFYSKKREELLEGIRKGVLTYPDNMPPITKDFLQRLFVKDPKNRLGAHNFDEIKRHPFFNDVDFEGLLNKTVTPPFIPKISTIFDTSNFDNEFTNLTLEKLDHDECINPILEDPAVSPLQDRDMFFDWYFDKRYPQYYFTTDPADKEPP